MTELEVNSIIENLQEQINDLRYDLSDKEWEISDLEDEIDRLEDEIEMLKEYGDRLEDEIEMLKEYGDDDTLDNSLEREMKEELWAEVRKKYSLAQLESIFGNKYNLK